MTQAPTDFNVTQDPDDGGATLVPMTDIQDRNQELFDALLSAHSGAAQPSYAVAGIVWRNSTTGALLMYDGTSDQRITIMGVQAELTIAAGAITMLNAGTIVVDTEADAASDDLDTITATNAIDGDIIVLKAAGDARTVVIKDGTGNIACGADFSLDNTLDRIMLQWDAGNATWVMLSSQSNAA